MAHFAESLHPDDVPDWHKGDYDGPSCGYALYGPPAICACGKCEVADDPEPDPDDDGDPEPTTRFEDTATYRDQLKDAGRGHLVRW